MASEHHGLSDVATVTNGGGFCEESIVSQAMHTYGMMSAKCVTQIFCLCRLSQMDQL